MKTRHKKIHFDYFITAIRFLFISLIFLSSFSCSKNSIQNSPAYQITKNISYGGVNVQVVIDKPEGDNFDAILVFHGTVGYDSLILNAANETLNTFKGILDRKDMLMVSVAYPEENLLFGDNIYHCEAALLWVKNKIKEELNITVNKIFLAGHSQGGYQVTRLNTMHATNGVIANAPGPLNLVFRCQLEENGQIQPGEVCTRLKNEYGTTTANADAYMQRSLLNFTNGFLSDILFVQGLDDSPIQMYSWPVFKQDVENCSNCAGRYFVEVPGAGHPSLFYNQTAITAFNQFINSRR